MGVTIKNSNVAKVGIKTGCNATDMYLDKLCKAKIVFLNALQAALIVLGILQWFDAQWDSLFL